MMKQPVKTRVLLFSAAFALTACGGGGGGGSAPDPGPGTGAGGAGGNGAIIGGSPEIIPPSGPPTANVLDSLVVPAAQAAAATKGVAVASVAVRPKAVSLALPQWSDAPSPVMPLPGLPMQIGAPRELSSLQSAGDMARTLNWSQTPEGGQVAAISITSAGDALVTDAVGAVDQITVSATSSRTIADAVALTDDAVAILTAGAMPGPASEVEKSGMKPKWPCRNSATGLSAGITT